MSSTWLMVLATVCWGLWAIFDKLSLRSLHASQALLVAGMVSGLAAPMTFWFLRPSDLPRWAPGGVGWAALAALLSWIAMVAYFIALTRRDAGVVAGYTSAYPLITCLVGAVVLDERLSGTKLLALGLVVAGLLLLGRA